MKTEQKAKAYDEALEQAQKELAACGSINCDAARQIFRLFPQLRESEDERIRKILIRIVKCACGKYGIKYKGDEITEEKLIAYLEKQKDHFRDDTKMVEQKPAEKETTLNGFEKALDSFLFDFAHSSITDCEPKEYIKNHSTYLIKAAYKELNAQLKQDLFEAQQEGRREGYEAAKNELKPTEWSEEDEKMLQRIIRHTESEYQDWCNDKYGNSEIVSDGKRSCLERLDWLENRFKSLRPQPQQKQQIKEGDKVSIHCRRDRKEDIITSYDGKVGEVIHVWNAKKHPWGHIIVKLDNGFNDGFYEDELEVLDEPSWKPSKEQMEALKCAIEDIARFSRRGGRQVELENEPYYSALHSLYCNLEKLM